MLTSPGARRALADGRDESLDPSEAITRTRNRVVFEHITVISTFNELNKPFKITNLKGRMIISDLKDQLQFNFTFITKITTE